MLIEIPKNTRVLELPSSTIWFDKDGILYSVGKPMQGPRTMDEIMEDMIKVRGFIGDRKVCIIVESNSKSEAPPREHRDAVAEALGSVTKAMAIVSSSPLSRMVANLFFSFKPPAYPMKLFSNPQDARTWLLKHC